MGVTSVVVAACLLLTVVEGFGYQRFPEPAFAFPYFKPLFPEIPFEFKFEKPIFLSHQDIKYRVPGANEQFQLSSFASTMSCTTVNGVQKCTGGATGITNTNGDVNEGAAVYTEE